MQQLERAVCRLGHTVHIHQPEIAIEGVVNEGEAALLEHIRDVPVGRGLLCRPLQAGELAPGDD